MKLKKKKSYTHITAIHYMYRKLLIIFVKLKKITMYNILAPSQQNV